MDKPNKCVYACKYKDCTIKITRVVHWWTTAIVHDDWTWSFFGLMDKDREYVLEMAKKYVDDMV